MFKRLFIDHPRTVDETYFEHFLFAANFGIRMIVGGAGALVHAVVPGLCATAGSDMIKKLNSLVVNHREKKRAANIEMTSVDYVI